MMIGIRANSETTSSTGAHADGDRALLETLQTQVPGGVILPEDAAYEQVRRGWNLLIDQRPAVIVRPRYAHEVLAGIEFARAARLGVSVQSTGHGIHHPADNNLLVVTSQMNRVYVDVDAATARMEAGAVWQQVLDAATPHGLAPLLGSSPHVGVIGYTLGGGVGWLARRYGFAADSVRWIDIVTGDGVLRRASPAENPNLFWGLRGGGGNFGVVTALGIQLYRVTTLYGGHLVYDGAHVREALGFFRTWTASAPDALTSSLAIMKYPDAPMLPEAIRGKIQVMVRAAYAGPASEGAALMQPWLDWRTPQENAMREMPFAEIAAISNDPVNPAAVYGSNEMFDELPDGALDIIARHATNPASPLVLAELRHVGGAIQRMAADASAIGNRDAQFYFQLGGPIFQPNGKVYSAAYIRQVKSDLQPYLRGSVYQNFMAGGEAFNRAQDAYGAETLQRLMALKARYDPLNLFRYSYQFVEARD